MIAHFVTVNRNNVKMFLASLGLLLQTPFSPIQSVEGHCRIKDMTTVFGRTCSVVPTPQHELNTHSQKHNSPIFKA